MEGRSRLTKPDDWKVSGQAVRCDMSQMLISITLSCDGERSLVAKLVMSHCQEKLLALIILYPYRKPTQVVEASSLR